MNLKYLLQLEIYQKCLYIYTNTNNKDFNFDDVYDVSRGTDKEDELFDYANIPNYMKSNKRSYNEKDKDNYDFER